MGIVSKEGHHNYCYNIVINIHSLNKELVMVCQKKTLLDPFLNQVAVRPNGGQPEREDYGPTVGTSGS